MSEVIQGRNANSRSSSSSSNSVSKLERLNARVVKLLEDAVQEVLEVVKETVTEYQDKTARTHRENIRLRLRLQDALQKLEKEKEGETVSKLVSASSSSQTGHTSIPQDATHLSQDSAEVQTDHPAIKFDEEPEDMCDVKVAVTLSDPETLTQTRTPNPEIKSEPIATECSSGLQHSSQHPPQNQISQVIVTIPNHQRMQPATPGGVGINSYTGNMWSSTGSRFEPEPHQQSRELEENHICLVCGKSFSRVGNLRTHQRCHTGEKPYRCLVCGRGFTQGGDLKKHERVHTGEKPYCCLVCGKSFSRGENLKRHQKIHMCRQDLWRDFTE